MSKKVILAAMVVATTFVACDKENESDTTKPVIVLESPAQGATLKAGDASGIHLDMELSDDVALGSYKIDIHNADDDHSHASLSLKSTESFAFNKSWDDIAGQKNAHVHQHEIVIPADAKHGKYHMIVYCTDQARNESYVVREIYISDHSDTTHH